MILSRVAKILGLPSAGIDGTTRQTLQPSPVRANDNQEGVGSFGKKESRDSQGFENKGI